MSKSNSDGTRPPAIRQLDRALSAVFEGFTGEELYVTHDGQPARVALHHSGPSNTELGAIHWSSVVNDFEDYGMDLGVLISHRRVERDLTQRLYEVAPHVFVEKCRRKGAGCHVYVLVDVSDFPNDVELERRLKIAEDQLSQDSKMARAG